MLDHDRIKRRRKQLNITQRGLARQLGVSLTVVTNLESGINHDDLPLGLVRRLVDALALEPCDLLTSGPEDATTDVGSAPDAAAVGVLLTQLDALAELDTLAHALQWPLQRAADAVNTLADRLDGTGIRLHQLGSQVALRPASNDSPDVLRRLHRRQQARRGLTLTEARVLHRAWAGRLDPHRLGNADRVALQRLQAADLVGDDGRPSGDVQSSLAAAGGRP